MNYIKDIDPFIIAIRAYYFKMILQFFLLFLLIFQIVVSYKKIQLESTNRKNLNLNNPVSKYWYNLTFLKNEMHSYSLYNEFKIPKISLVLMHDKNKQNIYKTIKRIKQISSKNNSNIEIILFLENENKTVFNLTNNEFKNDIKDGMLKIYESENDIEKDYSNIINIIKGSYTIFINNIKLLKNINVIELFIKIKNNINHYFEYIINKNTVLYVIKSCSLKNFDDNGTKFSSLEKIIESIMSIPNPNLNNIYITLCLNNYYTSLTYVSISSILSSKSSNTFIIFYLFVPSDFNKKNMNFLNSLYEMYDYFNITFIKMDNRYDNAYTSRNITKESYFRFSIGELLPQLNKIIYLDTDVIVYKDLSNFYNLNFNGKMILGLPTIGNRDTMKKGLISINNGILLLNLHKMREIKLEKKVIRIIKKGVSLDYHDQTLLNDNFNKYLGIFPPEYGTRPWSNYKEIGIFNYKIGNIFDQDYLYFVHKYPTIRHFFGEFKPVNPEINHIEDWWFFARKSKYYNSNATSFDSAFSF